MCLILLAIDSHPGYSLIIASNRDEFYDRPSEPAHFWKDCPNMLAGRDLKAQGTWLGFTRDGKFATLTNFRDPASRKDDAPSRGHLVSDYLKGHESPEQYILKLKDRENRYNGFNLVLGEHQRLFYYSNLEKVLRRLSSGIFGLSNQLLDIPWPKLVRGKENFKHVISDDREISPDDIFPILQDKTLPDDDSLPDTGVGLEKERMLAPVFIKSPDYGTRSTTIILVDKKGRVSFVERTYNTKDNIHSDVNFEFQITSFDKMT